MHDLSQAALAGAVLTLGLVIMLELRSIVRLRRLVDGHLTRVFEQLDLLRFENQQLLEAQSRTPRESAPVRERGEKAEHLDAARDAARDLTREPGIDRALATGEVRLLAAMAAARAKVERSPSTSSGPANSAR